MSRVQRSVVRSPRQSRPPAAAPAAAPAKLTRRMRIPKVVGSGDAVLTAAVLALIAFGVVMVYSASAVYANRQFDNGQFYLVRQGIYACLGIFVILVLARFDYHRFQNKALTYAALGGCTLLLLLVVLGAGHSAGGARRWLQIGPINLQPAEITKLAIILWLAYSLAKKRTQIRSFTVGFLPHLLVSGFLMLLCLKQPDFGSAVMIGVLTMLLLFAAGVRVGYIVCSIAIAAPAAWALIASSPYRMRRIQAFLEPFEHRYDVGYQIFESLVSFGAGGVTGVGIGDSRQKLFFLPEAHTDFISAIIGEELGLVGVIAVLLTFSLVVVRGLMTAYRACDEYGTLLAFGITMFVGLQAFTNLAVAMGMLPTKGLVLPFISYGGSSLLVNCAAVGILINISRRREPLPAAATAGKAEPGDRPKTRRRRERVKRGPGRRPTLQGGQA